MIKVSSVAFIKVTLLAIILFITSSLISRQKVQIPLYNGATGGGVASATSSEGFPINYIDNLNGTVGYSVVWIKLLLNSIIWLIVSVFIYIMYRRLATKK